MKFTKILVLLLLSWTAFDLNLHRRRRESPSSAISDLTPELQNSNQRQKKKIVQQSLSVIPKYVFQFKRKAKSKCNHKSVKSKDPRDSDQRKIRRKFSNL